MNYVLAIHGGAGTILPGADEAPYHAALHEAAAAGEAVLAAGGSALDAVTAAVVALEDCVLFNAGRGSVYTSDARQEMDAIVMNGIDCSAGAVAGVYTVEHPVLLARAVMERSNCVLLVGEGAERFARSEGFAFTPPEFFASAARFDQLRRAQAEGSGTVLDHSGAAKAAAPIDEDSKFGTVGAVARDRNGNLASAVSTGGMTNKRPGRVGDTPIVGAGFYAENGAGACACTGAGEMTMRCGTARMVVAALKAGAPVDYAVQYCIEDLAKLTAGRIDGVTVHAIDAKGGYAVGALNSKGSAYYLWTDGRAAPIRQSAAAIAR